MTSGTGDFLRLLVGELGTPKLAQIFAYGKWLYPYIMLLLHGASDLDKRYLKNASTILRTNVLSHQISSHLPPKSLFNAKPIIQRALRQSHVNGATTLKLYGYIGIGNYLGCIKIFPLGGVQGRRVP